MTDHEIHQRAEATTEAAHLALARNDRANRLVSRVLAVSASLLIVLTVGFGTVNLIQQDQARARSQRQQAEILTIVHKVLAVTNPNSSYTKTATKEEDALINHLISCLENHDDQVVAAALGKTPPATVPGCPADDT